MQKSKVKIIFRKLNSDIFLSFRGWARFRRNFLTKNARQDYWKGITIRIETKVSIQVCVMRT